MVETIQTLLLLLLITFARTADESCEATVTNENKVKRRSLSETTAEIHTDISPGQYRQVEVPPQVQFWVSFINDRNENVELFWDDGTEKGRNNGMIGPLSSNQVGTYRGHKFFIRSQQSDEKLASFVMDPDKEKYILSVPEEMLRLETEAIQKERAFKKEYRNKTGKDWIAYYPREPTKLYIYPATEIGEIVEVESNYGYYHCYPASTSDIDINKCRDNNTLKFEIKFVSISPKVMSIEHVLSDFECDHIIEVSRNKLERSTIGQGDSIEVSYTRTSTSTFISRQESEIMDWIHRRIADIMNIDEGHLWNHIGCEDLQVLHYDVGQQFYDHPDYGTEEPNTRYLTFLMYLNDVEEGGHTEFRSVDLSVAPKKGNVAAFYSMTEDGNLDIGSIHAGRPIIKGEKWASPLWIWDPHR